MKRSVKHWAGKVPSTETHTRVASFEGFTLYQSKHQVDNSWIEFKLIATGARAAHKANYWLLWNSGEKSFHGRDVYLLKKYRPSLYEQVLEWLQLQRSTQKPEPLQLEFDFTFPA